ncbi:MAG: type II toxin-antitoxin system VapC family toxin [Chloroflexi bacterium]|jgi:predicted nucleic acid-binding protein|nr:type II toxin-antitoxin system VapC family toxin [Chloroflexota bacterium]
MNDALTIDASVFVNAFSPTERGSEQSWRFLAQIREAEIPVFVPTLMLVEVVASLARKQNNTTLAMEWMEEIQQLSFLTLIPLDDDLARESAVIAASHRLRGSDAVYVAVARRFGAALVTLDSEQAQRAAPLVPVRLPASD